MLYLDKPQITLEAIKRRIQADDIKIIYYGAMTCWWTLSPLDLYIHKNGLPCDPRGGLLLECHDPMAFIRQAEENPGHYGRHVLKSFMAAYHQNVRAENGLPTCFEDWEDYNALIDADESGW